MSDATTPGKRFQDKLQEQIRALQNGFPSCSRERPVIWNVTPVGGFINGLTSDAFFARAGEILLESGRIYRWEDSLVFETAQCDPCLLPLSQRGAAEPGAASILANLVVIGVQGEDKVSQSVMPTRLVSAVLNDEDLWQRLPEIKTYARRAVFDDDFRLRGPGWHGDQGILVHGPNIVPTQLPAVAPTGTRSIDRLPPYLRRLLEQFCWASDADLENALALFVTGLLANHFVNDPKPIAMIDGNQPEVGKTLLAQVLGRVLDGCEPERLLMVRDEELEKKIGAKLRESKSSIVLLDNMRTKIESAFLEANAHSPLLSVRQLGRSRNINRPNSYLWVVTSNFTSGTSDFISRGIPIRLRYEGDPRIRSFTENLVRYASHYQQEILGELAGFIQRWCQMGRPRAQAIWPAGLLPPQHRCFEWVQILGGILGASGFFSFLGNVEEARAAMDEGVEALATLVECLLSRNPAGFVNPPANDPQRGKLPKEWGSVFDATGVFRDKLADKSTKGRDTFIGTFLSGKVNRPIRINIGSCSGTATLRRNPVRGDQNRYFFEATPDAEQPGPDRSAADQCQPFSSPLGGPAVAIATEPVDSTNLPATPATMPESGIPSVAPMEDVEWV